MVVTSPTTAGTLVADFAVPPHKITVAVPGTDPAPRAQGTAGRGAPLQLLSVVVGTGKPVSEVAKRFEPLPQILQNVRYANGAPLEHDAVRQAIDTGLKRLGSQGRLVIRPSGTEPVIRVMAEGDDRSLVAEVVDEVVAAVAKAAA